MPPGRKRKKPVKKKRSGNLKGKGVRQDKDTRKEGRLEGIGGVMGYGARAGV